MGVVFSSTQGEELTLGRLSEGRGSCLVCFLRGQVLEWGGLRPEHVMGPQAGDPSSMALLYIQISSDEYI